VAVEDVRAFAVANPGRGDAAAGVVCNERSDVLGEPGPRGDRMFKLLLISIVVTPVLLGMAAARQRSRRHGLVLLLVVIAAYDALYVAMLYYLRLRWVSGTLGLG
jgi:hypothetical protein